MPFKLSFDRQDDVPEALKYAVTEVDGKWVVEGESSSEIANLRATKDKERDARVRLEKEVKKFERFKDVTDDEWDAYEEFKLKGPGEDKTPPDLQKQIADAVALAEDRLRKRHERELGPLKERAVSLETENRELSIWTRVRELANKAGVLPKRTEQLIKNLRADNRFDLSDGKELIFREADGSISGLTPEKAFEELLPTEFDWAFADDGAGGSGAPPRSKSGSPSGAKTVRRGDQEALNASIEDIASGKVVVVE